MDRPWEAREKVNCHQWGQNMRSSYLFRHRLASPHDASAHINDTAEASGELVLLLATVNAIVYIQHQMGKHMGAIQNPPPPPGGGFGPRHIL